jgi:hypothetical protein
VLCEQATGLGGVDAALGAAHQLGAELPLEQRHLARDRGLSEVQLRRGRGEGAVGEDRSQRRQLGEIQHAVSLGLRCRIPMHGYEAKATSAAEAVRDR